MARTYLGGILAVLVFCIAMVPAAAQTPSAGVTTECNVWPPVEVLDLLAMLNDVDEANSYLPRIDSIAIQDITQGKAISAEDMEAISFTTTNLVGCANSLEVMSMLALFTREFQARFVAFAVNSPDMEEIVAVLPILAADTASNEGILAIPILAAWYADGNERSIQAVLQPVVSDPNSQHSYLVTFVFSIDRWLIDDVRPIESSNQS